MKPAFQRNSAPCDERTEKVPVKYSIFNIYTEHFNINCTTGAAQRPTAEDYDCTGWFPGARREQLCVRYRLKRNYEFSRQLYREWYNECVNWVVTVLQKDSLREFVTFQKLYTTETKHHYVTKALEMITLLYDRFASPRLVLSKRDEHSPRQSQFSLLLLLQKKNIIPHPFLGVVTISSKQ